MSVTTGDQHQGSVTSWQLADADLLAGKGAVSSGADASESTAALGSPFYDGCNLVVLARLGGESTSRSMSMRNPCITSPPATTSAPAPGRVQDRRYLAKLWKRGCERERRDRGLWSTSRLPCWARERSAVSRRRSYAPMAEKIHRHDLTVPESLLQPMPRDGCVRPVDSGGKYERELARTATREHVPMMIASPKALSEASLAAAGT